LRCDMGKVRDRCGGMGRYQGGLRCKGRVNCVITHSGLRHTYDLRGRT